MAKFNLNQILNDASKRAAPGGGGKSPAVRPMQIERLSVFDLVPSEDNFYSMNDIEELKSKIELAGKVLQNFIVVPLGGGKYKVISGHRRRLASIALVKEGKPGFEFVPCVIEENEANAEVQAVREEIMLIAANSQREKTAWDKIEETRRTRVLMERIKKEERLPGDIRKLVAQTLHTSPAQIGRYDAIIRNLHPAFMEELKADRLNISTAYELSGLSAEDQAAAFEEYKKTGEISIRAARERKQEPTVQEPDSRGSARTASAEREQQAVNTPRGQTPPQTAAEPPKEERRKETLPMEEPPAVGRAKPKEQPEDAGAPARSSTPPADAEPVTADSAGENPMVDIVRQLKSLCEYCREMESAGKIGRDWTADASALEFAINQLADGGRG